MNAGDTLPDPIFDELDEAACNRALAILIDVGTALAQECKATGPDASSLADRAKAFERVATAVRRTPDDIAILCAQAAAQTAQPAPH